MGYGVGAFEWITESLAPHGGAILDLGAQEFHRQERIGFVGHEFIRRGFYYQAIDVQPEREKFIELIDLNESPPPCYRFKFDVVTNFGTTEHVFNQATAFEFVHRACTVGGVMVHSVPMANPSHGLFNYTPLFFRELQRANHYQAVTPIWRDPHDWIITVALRKLIDAPFKFPVDLSND